MTPATDVAAPFARSTSTISRPAALRRTKSSVSGPVPFQPGAPAESAEGSDPHAARNEQEKEKDKRRSLISRAAAAWPMPSARRAGSTGSVESTRAGPSLGADNRVIARIEIVLAQEGAARHWGVIRSIVVRARPFSDLVKRLSTQDARA